MERILIIAGHPDDEVLGCGGTIAKCIRQGSQVRVAFLAEGITARYLLPEIETAKVQSEIRHRNQNAVKAMGVLGVPPEHVFVGQRYCCRLDQVPIIDLVKEIEHHIREFRPSQLFSHAADDPNIDHGLIHRALLAATRPLNISFLKSIYAFEVLSSTEWNPTRPFQPNVFHDITDFIDTKIQALAAYDNEMRQPPHPRSEQVVRALAAYRGAQAGLQYAEGFSLIRSICP